MLLANSNPEPRTPTVELLGETASDDDSDKAAANGSTSLPI